MQANKKQDLMEATMQIISEDGIDSFVMKKATQRVGVSEALIYKYFETKDNLLQLCFESVNRQIAALFHDIQFPDVITEESAYQATYALWIKYIRFLVKNDYRTIFYFSYRDSSYIHDVIQGKDVAGNTYFRHFVTFIESLNQRFGFMDEIDEHYLWTYILDLTGMFAKRIIQKTLPDTAESYQQIWKLMSSGLFGLLRKEVCSDSDIVNVPGYVRPFFENREVSVHC